MAARILFSLICFSCLFHDSFSQISHSSLLRGKVLDSKTKSPIPFVNVYYRSSGEGTSSSQSGDYAIQVNASHHSDTVVFSAIGYKTVKFPVTEIIEASANGDIYLEEAVIGLKEITVSADPAVEIVRRAMQSRPNNYGVEPHTLSGIYRIADREDGAFVRLVEAAVENT